MLFSVGHSNKSFKNLLKRLQTHNIDVLVDVRAYPQSKRLSWFNQDNLTSALESEKIDYKFMGLALNNNPYPETNITLFNECITELIILSESKNIAIMGSSGLPYPSKYSISGCHRWWKITQYIQKHCPQRLVHHILMDGSLRHAYPKDYMNHQIDFNGNSVRKNTLKYTQMTYFNHF